MVAIARGLARNVKALVIPLIMPAAPPNAPNKVMILPRLLASVPNITNIGPMAATTAKAMPIKFCIAGLILSNLLTSFPTQSTIFTRAGCNLSNRVMPASAIRFLRTFNLLEKLSQRFSATSLALTVEIASAIRRIPSAPSWYSTLAPLIASIPNIIRIACWRSSSDSPLKASCVTWAIPAKSFITPASS